MQVIRHHIAVKNISEVERWTSLIGGGLLAASAFRRNSKKHGLMLMAAGELLRRGLTGYCYLYGALGFRTAPRGQGAPTTSLPYELGIRAEAAVTVDQPRETVYRFWRSLEKLPLFMKHLESVIETDATHSRWTSNGPAGKKMVWDAEIHNEIEKELIAWRSLAGADVDNAGSVTFKDAPGGRGTEIRVLLQYNPPGGVAGAYFAKLFGEEPSQQIEADLGRLKQYLETGEIATTEGQPKGPTKRELREREIQQRRAAQTEFSSVPSVGGGMR